MGGMVIGSEDHHQSVYEEKHRRLSFATASMRGWRPYMEDTDVAIYPLH